MIAQMTHASMWIRQGLSSIAFRTLLRSVDGGDRIATFLLLISLGIRCLRDVSITMIVLLAVPEIAAFDWDEVVWLAALTFTLTGFVFWRGSEMWRSALRDHLASLSRAAQKPPPKTRHCR